MVVAEAIGGDEETFARMMTRKARALGMSRTVYNNASGLPDEDQLTTARDQATLGRAIQDRFPRYYRYFATPSFTYRGHAMRNHNKLLGRVEGVDGIKTGYTRASGFNLVSSVRRGNRHVVAVVLGGASGGSARRAHAHPDRAAHRERLEQPHRRQDRETTDVAAAAPKISKPEVVAKPEFRPIRDDVMAPVQSRAPPARDDRTGQARAAAAPRAVLARAPKPGSGEPINPVKVKTITVKAGNVQTAALVPLVAPTPQAAQSRRRTSRRTRAAPLRRRRARPGVLGVLPAEPAQPATVYQTAAATSAPVTTESVAPRQPHPRGPWIIQVGAFPKETEAKDRLREAQSLAKSMLAKADPFTERFVKGNQEYYRARFAGFDQHGAEAACKYFKRNDIACLAIRN